MHRWSVARARPVLAVHSLLMNQMCMEVLGWKNPRPVVTGTDSKRKNASRVKGGGAPTDKNLTKEARAVSRFPDHSGPFGTARGERPQLATAERHKTQTPAMKKAGVNADAAKSGAARSSVGRIPKSTPGVGTHHGSPTPLLPPHSHISDTPEKRE